MATPEGLVDDQLPLQRNADLTNNMKYIFLADEQKPKQSWREKLSSRLKIKNEYIRLILAEFIGTFVLISIGLGCMAQATLSKGADGNIVTIMFGWGLAVAMGVYTCGGVSDGHVNPAVTTAMVVLGRVPLIKLPCYFAGQYLGAFFGSVCVFLVYKEGLNNFDKSRTSSLVGSNELPNATFGIWSTFPKMEISVGESFFDQVFATALLVLLIMAITDKRNTAPPKGTAPLLVGFAITALLSSYVYNCGAALNPARDFAPRLFSMMAGWGTAPFSFRNHKWFWIPIVGPHIGAIVGALFYNICVGLHWPELNDIDRKAQ